MNASSGSGLWPRRMRTARTLPAAFRATSAEPVRLYAGRAMAKPVLSDAIQDYLKEIYKLGGSGDRVTVTALARAVGVSAPSASTMLKKLAALGLLEHQPYRGVRLTPRV